jgi:gliding motility-associated-like protein
VLFGDRFVGNLTGPCGNDNGIDGLFQGKLDDIGIWNRALTPCEVYQLYTGIIATNPIINLGNDTTLTQGSTLTLNAGNTSSTYLWNTGATTQTINVNTTGAYWVKVTNSGGCYSTDTIQVNFNNCAVNQLPLNLQQGLVAYYPFCGNANDESGNVNNGIVNGATLTNDRFGNINSAYNFAGVNNPQTIHVPNSNSLQFTNKASFSLWVNMNSYYGMNGNGNSQQFGEHILYSKDYDYCCLYCILSGVSNSEYQVGAVSDGWSNGIIVNDSISGSCINHWTHIAIVYLPNEVLEYINGVLVKSNTGTTSFTNSNSHDLWFGRLSTFWYPLDGKLDDIGIWNRSLTSCEVWQLYTGQAPTPPIVNLGNDTTLSLGSTLQLNAGNTGSTYLWSTNDTTQTISINTTGTYWVKVTNSGGCFSSDTIYIDFTTSTTTNPMNDTTICKGETVTLTANAAATNTWQYFQNFENTVGSEWSDTNRITFNGSKNIGPYGNQTINLNLSSLPAHDSVEISFDLYIHDSWDGNPPNGPDFWNLMINNDTILNTTFSNNPGPYTQSFPQNYISNNPIQTGAYTINLPSRCLFSGTSLYKITKSLGNPSNLINLIFNGVLNSSVCDESWSIDNVKVKLLNVNSTSQYLWSTGATTSSINVSPNQTTNYSVTVTNGSTTFIDTATVYVLNPQINNGQDTTICKGESVILSANSSSQNACSKTQLPANLQQGLVAFYPFCGNANDKSGNAHNGTVHGAILTTDRFGNANSAYNYNGTSDYIKTNAAFFDVGWQNYSISGWICSNNINKSAQCYFNTIPHNGTDLQLNYFSNNKLSFFLNSNPNLFTWDISINQTGNTTNFNNNIWYHYTFVKNNNNYKLYLNGVLDANFNGTISPQNHLCNIVFGSIDPSISLSECFSGKLDDYAIYNRALSTSEIQQLYNLGSSNTTASTYLWSTNDTMQSITVTPLQTTTYTLTVTNGNINCMNSITVNVLNPQINNGQDTTICNGESVILNALTSSQNACNKSQLPANLQQGLVAFYPFCGNANDESGSGHNGVVNGAILTTDRFSNTNSAYLFNGVNNKITADTLPILNQYFSYSCWIKINGLTPVNIQSFGGLGGPQSLSHMWNFAYNPNLSIWDLYDYSNGSWYTNWTGQTSSSTLNWTNVTIVYSNVTEYLYVNGILLNQRTIVTPIQTFADRTLRLSEIGNQFFNGKIDDILIYNRALSISEISQIYNLGASTYLWSTNDTTQSITITPTQTTTYTLSVTNGNISCMDTITVNVLNPQINLGNDTTICQGQSKTLAVGSGFTSYLWSTGATTQQITAQNTGTYWVKAISNQGCTVSDTINLTFLPIQSNILKDTILCLGQSVIFNPGAGFTNHLWSTGATTTSLNVSLPGTFWLQVKQPNGCVVKDTAIVKYDSLNIVVSSFTNPTCYGGNNGSVNTTTTGLYPGFTYSWNTTPVITTANISNRTAGNYTVTVTDAKGCTKSVSKTLTAPNPVAVSLGNDTSICQGQSLTLQATQIFTSYLWSTGATTQSINVNAIGTYWLKGTNAAGCSGYDTVNITVNPAPVIQITPGNPSICKGDSVTLVATSTIAGTTFNWSNGGNGSSITVSPLATANYTVIGSKNTCKDTATVTVTVNPIPVVTISPANPSVCKGDAITLNASSNLANTTFLWNNNSTNTTINVSPNTNTNYFVVGSLSPCKDTAFVTVTTKPLPVLSVTADKNPICEGETVKLTASSDIASTTYLWSNTSTAGFINVSPLSSSYYFVTGTASNCHDTAGINITVISKQTLNLGEDRYLCAGDEVNLTATNLTGSYLWSNGSNSSTIILTEPGVYWLRVDNNGCIASDTIEMKKCSEIWVPNVFTPNEDGINDIFRPVVTEIQKLTINIYNRWGEMIFETSDINGGWNGKIHNNEAPTGVYFWIIKYYENRSSAQDIQKEIKGSVTLLR